MSPRQHNSFYKESYQGCIHRSVYSRFLTRDFIKCVVLEGLILDENMIGGIKMTMDSVCPQRVYNPVGKAGV